jgi:hypothetical protein
MALFGAESALGSGYAVRIFDSPRVNVVHL